MKNLRKTRLILAGLFLVLSVAYVFAGGWAGRLGTLSFRSQIIPSMISVALGATLFWLVITIIYGRIYCATVCPAGTLIDIASRLRRFLPASRRRYRYRPRRQARYHILAVYAICLIAGITVVPALIEPWNIFANIAAVARPDASALAAAGLGIGAATGIAAGAASLLAMAAVSVLWGREFCNTVCPVGTVLSIAGSNAAYRIEIDPDRCTGCLICEDVCPAGCVKVVGRYVDDQRCVRCMKCVDSCPDGAIRWQSGRNRAATPLMKRAKSGGV
ncbi:MAG: 4Fe-4S binding protein [Muribaculaceae bacterium]|nr:4Fe-4S binding protein [Muribaculaceae bacterium]